jgi:glycosyltransferase A (GT-A) superfamily protein (DUF2064 family)
MNKQLVGVVIFTKIPSPGFVKTRLQNPHLPPDFAFRLQTAMLLDTISVLKYILGEIVPVITYHPKNRFDELKTIIIEPLKEDSSNLISSLHFVPQDGESFIDRFKNAFKYVFNDLNLNSAFILGSDTPHIQPSILQSCIQLLTSNQLNSVLGPSQRGGFYLLGHNGPYNYGIGEIFDRNSLYQELGAAMDFLIGFSNVNILPEVTDIDLFEDLKTVRSILHLLSLINDRGNTIHFPKHTYELINSLDDRIWQE